jgi:hypothetical protein
MEDIGVSTKYVIVDDSYHTSFSHVFIDSYFMCFLINVSNSDQHTYMFRGATNLITPEIVEKYFVPQMDSAKIITSEVSQVPLPSVLALFKAAGERKIPRFLDMDLPLSVAIGAAKLGTRDEVGSQTLLKCSSNPVSTTARFSK